MRTVFHREFPTARKCAADDDNMTLQLCEQLVQWRDAVRGSQALITKRELDPWESGKWLGEIRCGRMCVAKMYMTSLVTSRGWSS